MGEDGTRYEVTEYPEHVDIMGVLQKSEQTDPRDDPLPDSNQPGMSTNPGMSSPSLDAFFSDLNEERNKGECEEEYGGDDKPLYNGNQNHESLPRRSAERGV